MATVAVDAHPTGMHSRTGNDFNIRLRILFSIKYEGHRVYQILSS